MEELSLGIFVVPTIALTLVILGYLYFAKQVTDIGEYRRFVFAVAVTSFMLNFIWELAQGPLYEGFEYDLKHISFCALASVADMLMVFILLLVLVGFFGAILAEVWHTARGDWAYVDAMPRLPVAEVGISPVLQFTILPWLIFLICKKFIMEKV